MLSIDALKAALNTFKALGSQASHLAAGVTSKVQAIERDDSRSAKWKAEQIAAIRKAGIDSMAEVWREIKARYGELMAEHVYWESPMLALGQYGVAGFTKGSPQEMTVRGQALAELSMMGSALLRLEAQGAASNRDWARLYLACLVFENRGARIPTNLESLPIGNMAEAEEVFFEAELTFRTAEIDLFAVRGQRSSSQNLVAIGLLKMRQEAKRKARAAVIVLNWDERNPVEEEDPNDPISTIDRKEAIHV